MKCNPHLKLERRYDGLEHGLGAGQVVHVHGPVRSTDDSQRVVDVHRVYPLGELKRVGGGGAPAVPDTDGK